MSTTALPAAPDREQRILEAADSLFGEAGYEATSVQQVADRAEVNKALVFYYFRSKERLFEQVLQRYYDSHRVALAAALVGDDGLCSRLHRMIDAYLDFMLANVGYARLVQGQLAGEGAHVAVIARNMELMQASVAESLGDVAPQSGPLAARQFFVTFSGAVINYFTYAPALTATWGGDPLGEQAIADRRAHLHWLVDAIVDRLPDELPTGSAARSG